MLTLLRPLTSESADQIENQLDSMMAAYEVITKEASNEPYLIQSGKVMSGESIVTFLKKYQPELASQKSVPSDSREIG